MKLRLFYTDGGSHPVLGRIYYPCQEVHGDGDEKRYQRYIANILSCIASSVEDCDRILSIISEIELNVRANAEISGNDVDVMLSKGRVQVDITVNDDWVGNPEGGFSLTEFKVAVSAWKRFLALPESLEVEVVDEL